MWLRRKSGEPDRGRRVLACSFCSKSQDDVRSRLPAVACHAANAPTRSRRALVLLPFLPAHPVLVHLREPFHEDRRALALFLAVHRLQETEGLLEVLLNRLAGRLEVEATNLGQLVVGGQHPDGRHRAHAWSSDTEV